MTAKARANRIAFGHSYGRSKAKSPNQLRREMKRLTKAKSK